MSKNFCVELQLLFDAKLRYSLQNSWPLTPFNSNKVYKVAKKVYLCSRYAQYHTQYIRYSI